jgi:EAL domain-containing protein (putative c-di-GMP-specific phosphodiesterase class I)
VAVEDVVAQHQRDRVRADEALTDDEGLRELGCTLGQGYLFSEPVGPEVIEERLGATEAEAVPRR